MKIRALIVDDEMLSRRGLELRLAQVPDFEIVGQCASGREAIPAIHKQRPDVVFLDIEMPGMSGFDVLAGLSPGTVPLVVCVTAFDNHAIRAFEARALDYLLKPLDDARLAVTLDRIREALGARHAGILPIRQGKETLRVRTDSIDWIDAAGDYMCVHAAGQTHVLRTTMKELEQLLDPQLFHRVHRSTIVNLARVRSMRAHMNGEYFLTLEDGHELKLSRSYRAKVEYLLKGARRG